VQPAICTCCAAASPTPQRRNRHQPRLPPPRTAAGSAPCCNRGVQRRRPRRRQQRCRSVRSSCRSRRRCSRRRPPCRPSTSARSRRPTAIAQHTQHLQGQRRRRKTSGCCVPRSARRRRSPRLQSWQLRRTAPQCGAPALACGKAGGSSWHRRRGQKMRSGAERPTSSRRSSPPSASSMFLNRGVPLLVLDCQRGRLICLTMCTACPLSASAAVMALCPCSGHIAHTFQSRCRTDRRLRVACARLDVNITAALINTGADVCSCDSTGRTPLHYMASAPRSEAAMPAAHRVMVMLLRNGAQVSGS